MREETDVEKEDIYSINEWYMHLPASFNDLETLIHKRRMLVGFYNRLAREYKDKLKEYNTGHANRRISEALKIMQHVDSYDEQTSKGMLLGKAQAKTLTEIQKEYKHAYELKGLTEGYKVLKDSVQETLKAMHQDIADLRQLLGNTQRTEQDNS